MNTEAQARYRHGETFLAIGPSKALLERAGVPALLADVRPDLGLVLADAARGGAATIGFLAALVGHRHPERKLAPAAH